MLPSSSSSSSSSISRFEDEDRYAEDEDDYEADLRESMSNRSMPNSVIDPTSQEKFYHSGFTIALASTGQLARSCVPAVRSIYTDHPLTVKRRAFSFPISAFQLFSLSHPHTHTLTSPAHLFQHFSFSLSFQLSAFQLFPLLTSALLPAVNRAIFSAVRVSVETRILNVARKRYKQA